jgi:hypothetical protein
MSVFTFFSGSNTFPSTIRSPLPGTPLTAQSVQSGSLDLANRTTFLNTRITAVSQSLAGSIGDNFTTLTNDINNLSGSAAATDNANFSALNGAINTLSGSAAATDNQLQSNINNLSSDTNNEFINVRDEIDFVSGSVAADIFNINQLNGEQNTAISGVIAANVTQSANITNLSSSLNQRISGFTNLFPVARGYFQKAVSNGVFIKRQLTILTPDGSETVSDFTTNSSIGTTGIRNSPADARFVRIDMGQRGLNMANTNYQVFFADEYGSNLDRSTFGHYSVGNLALAGIGSAPQKTATTFEVQLRNESGQLQSIGSVHDIAFISQSVCHFTVYGEVSQLPNP